MQSNIPAVNLARQLNDIAGVTINWQQWEAFNLRLLGPDGVVLFQFLVYQCTRLEPQNEGWFYHTQEKIQQKTGIKEKRQGSIITLLEEAGILEKKLKGAPAKLFYRIRFEELGKSERLAVIYPDLAPDQEGKLILFYQQLAAVRSVSQQVVSSAPVPTDPKAAKQDTSQRDPPKQQADSDPGNGGLWGRNPYEVNDWENKRKPTQQNDQATREKRSRKGLTFEELNKQKELLYDFLGRLEDLFQQRWAIYNVAREANRLKPIPLPKNYFKQYKFLTPALVALESFPEDEFSSVASFLFDKILYKKGKWASVETPYLAVPPFSSNPIGRLLDEENDFAFFRRCQSSAKLNITLK